MYVDIIETRHFSALSPHRLKKIWINPGRCLQFYKFARMRNDILIAYINIGLLIYSAAQHSCKCLITLLSYLLT